LILDNYWHLESNYNRTSHRTQYSAIYFVVIIG